MLFSSLEYALFLPAVFMLYWYVLSTTAKGQNLVLVIASYIFYGWWDWRFLSLLFLSSAVDFTSAWIMSGSRSRRVRLACLWTSMTFNLGLLGTFKYFNFFIESFAELLTSLGIQVNPWSLQIILPVGISFYTFQTMSYTLDVYFGNCKATKEPVTFLTFVSFFPQLVAGPIERARHLLPQFEKARTFDYALAVDGCRQILWGLFKKMVIADNAAIAADRVFSSYQSATAGELLLGLVYFAFQIYCDFSGYSDIAIGSAKLFGVRLLRNFHYPYFSRSMGEFWRRWHISLSSWFRDYVYIPLGGSRHGTLVAARNIFVVFILSGLWHGANWTFIIWGALNALFIIPSFFAQSTPTPSEPGVSFTPREYLGLILTFAGACLGWVFFRSPSISDALGFLAQMASGVQRPGLGISLLPLVGIAFLVCFEWRSRHLEFPLAQVSPQSVRRWSGYLMLSVMVLTFSPRQGATFIYFQF